jgi:putative transposase
VSRYGDQHRDRFGVEPICKTLGVSVSAYYQRRAGRPSARAVEDRRLLARIRALHAANYYAYGYRRMWRALRRAGEQVPRCQVQRLMRSNGIAGAKRRGKPWRTTRPDPQAQRRPDLVERDCAAAGPNELWVADLTYLRCWEGLVFFAFVLDAYSRMIVGWQLASHVRTGLVLDALRMALHRREPGADVELIHHSDRGSQYTSIDYTQTLTEHRVLASLGSVGDAYDNALAESFAGQRRNRADRRPPLAVPLPARTCPRRVHRLVQRRPPAREPRLHPAARVRTDAAKRTTNYARRRDGVTQLIRSPSKPVRLASPQRQR